jgi:histone H3/H4
MVMKMGELPLASVERIMRNAGAERISMNAIITMADILEDICRDISQEAIDLAKHSKRKTVKKEDVKLAARRLSI